MNVFTPCRRHTLLPVLVALMASGCSKPAPEQPAKQPVAVATPLQRDVVDWDEYVGRFEAIQDVQLRPRVSGTIDRILFADGQAVRKGQALFIIDPRPYQAALGQARAQVAKATATLRNARTEFARAERLLATTAISREEYEQKQAVVGTTAADLQAAQENVRNALLNLEFTTIRAPVAGRISDRRVSPGNYAAAGETILSRIVSTAPIWFSFEGAESLYLKYMRQARTGERGSSRTAANPVEIQLADEPTYRWRGKMSFVDNTIDSNSGTIRAHAVVANPDGFLTPGLFGRARLLGSGHYKAMLIPDEAILTDQTRRLVYVVDEDGKAQSKVVQTGPLVQGLRVIRSGIAATDRVVVEGATLLQPGTAVDARRIALKPRAGDTSPSAMPETAQLPSEATAD